MEDIVEHRSSFGEVPAFVMDYIGGHWIRGVRHPDRWRAVRFSTSCAASGLRSTTAWSPRRQRWPRAGAERRAFGCTTEDYLLRDLHSSSFPSGHTANAATLRYARAHHRALVAVRWSARCNRARPLSRTYLRSVTAMSATSAGAPSRRGRRVRAVGAIRSRIELELVRDASCRVGSDRAPPSSRDRGSRSASPSGMNIAG